MIWNFYGDGMEKLARIGLLNDLYGNLLTKKQQEILELFYSEDLSLGEIAEILQISRQGVFDAIQRSEKALEAYEEKLGLLQKSANEKLLVLKLAKAIEAKDWNLVQAVQKLLTEQ